MPGPDFVGRVTAGNETVMVTSMSNLETESKLEKDALSAEYGEIEEYVPLSKTAVGAVVCGVLSFATVFTPLLWLIPIVGIVLAVVSIRLIKNSDGTLTGRAVAIVGLTLTMFSAGLGISRFISHQQMFYSTARRNGLLWVKMLKERDLYQAYLLQMPHDRRPKASVDLKELYGELPERFERDELHQVENSTHREFRSYLCDPPMKQLIEHENAIVKLERIDNWTRSYFARKGVITDRIRLHFKMDYKDYNGQHQGRRFELMLERENYRDAKSWFIGGVDME